MSSGPCPDSGIPASGLPRRNENPDELLALPQQPLDPAGRDDLCFYEKLKPEGGFVGFFDDQAKFGDEIGV